jgi:kumamolisin
VLQLDLVLPLRDPAGLKRFLSDVCNPKVPLQALCDSRPVYGEVRPTRAVPTGGQLCAQMQVVGGSRDGMEVQVKGSVQAIETALHFSMNTY